MEGFCDETTCFCCAYNHIAYNLCVPLAFAEEKTGVELADNVKSAILIERDTGKVLYEKNSNESLPPASMTKIMTMLLIMEALDEGKLSYDEKVVRVSMPLPWEAHKFF